MFRAAISYIILTRIFTSPLLKHFVILKTYNDYCNITLTVFSNFSVFFATFLVYEIVKINLKHTSRENALCAILSFTTQYFFSLFKLKFAALLIIRIIFFFVGTLTSGRHGFYFVTSEKFATPGRPTSNCSLKANKTAHT